ncbi:MAG: NB-ARC domain-containing protein [Acidobacteria bacterium]|nr:MAG: NB-ARC domain-containing protein [Acidobacteriota bacterium]
MKRLRIFAASPSDVAAERAKVETVAAMLKPLAEHLGIVLEVVDWRAVVPDMGRPQQVIFDQLKPTSWDVFIGILWHRFGTPPAAQDQQTQREYLAGTEEEIKTAYSLWQQHGKPRIMIYRCTRPVPLDVLDPDQYKRVKDFFAQFEAVAGAHPGLIQTFDTTESFERLLIDNLQKLLIGYGEEISGKPIAPEVVQEYAPKIPDNLPRRAPFFGRDKEMGVVMRALSPEDRTWGVLLDGIGGIGKSALAVEAAYRCKESGQFAAFIFVSAKQNILEPERIRELKPAARTLDEFLNESARVLDRTDIAKLAGDDKRRALLDALRELRALLIYDNLETLSKDEQEALADFLRELPPGCKAIITSRRRGGEGAVWWRLEKLDWEAARAIIESEMARDEKLAQKLQRAGAARWSELYDETKGSPLALTHTLGLMRVRAALTFDGALDLLRGNRDPDLQHFIFQEARQELTTNDQTALRALSFFIPSATFEAWMEVAALSRNALETTIDRLSALSLVDVLANEDRYALHPLTRNFVRDELLADAQIARATGRRFAEYWMTYAHRFGNWAEESYKFFDRLEAEWMNLDASAEWLWQTAAIRDGDVGDKDAARRLDDLANGLNQFLWFSGHWEERVQLSARAYEAMRALNEWSQAGRRAYDVAWIHYHRANTSEAMRWTDRCTEAWAQGGSRYDQAISIRMCGLLAEQQKDYDAAERLFQDVLVTWRNLKDDQKIVAVLNDLGELERGRKQYDKADQYYREALALAEKQNLIESQANISVSMGLLALGREHWTEAREWLEKSLPLAREVGRQDLIAEDLHGLARVHEAEGHPDDLALPLAQEALTIYEKLRHRDMAETRALVERLKKKVGNE